MEHLPTSAILFLLPHSHNLLTNGAVYHFLHTETECPFQCVPVHNSISANKSLYMSGHPITATMLTNMIKGTPCT